MSYEAEQERLVDAVVTLDAAMIRMDGTLDDVDDLIGILYEGDGLRNSLYEVRGLVEQARAKLWATRPQFQ